MELGRSAVEETRIGSARLTVERPAPGVVLEVFKGHIGRAFVDPIMAPLERLAAHGARFVQLHDWSAVTGYDGEARVELTRRSLALRPHVAAFHLLASDPIVRMGVTVANLVLARFITLHGERSGFEAALAEAVSARP